MKRLIFLVLLSSSLAIGGCLKNQSSLFPSDSTSSTDESGASYVHPGTIGGQQGTQPPPPPKRPTPLTTPTATENYVNEHSMSRVVIKSDRKLRDVKVELGYEGYPAFSDIPAESDGTKTLWLPSGTHMVNAHAKKSGHAAVQNGNVIFYLWVNGVRLTHIAPRSVSMGGMFFFRVHADGSISPCTPDSECY